MALRIRIRALIPAAALAACVAASGGAARAESHHPVNLTLFYPIGTNQDPEISTSFRLSLLYGRVGSVKGIDLGGVAARIDRGMSGLQLAGLLSYVGGDLAGATVSAGINYVGGEARGIQAGFVNFDRGSFGGVQYGYAFNFVQGDVHGAQLSSIFSLVNGDARYLQLSGAANAVGGSFDGLQLAAALNHVNGAMTGMQLAAANVASEAKGAQVGLLNVAGSMRGSQIGIINISRKLDGVPIGGINWTEDVDADWVTWGSNFAGVASGVRTVVNDWYSILSVGAIDLLDELDESAFIGWHYGRRLRLSRGWSLGADVGLLHVIPQHSDDPAVNDQEHPAAQGRVLAEWRYSRKFSIFAGGGASAVWDAYDQDADVRGEPLFFGGVSLY